MSTIKIFLAILIIFPLSAKSIDSPSSKYLKVKPSKGVGVFGLLRNYQLLDQSENLQAFYQLNNLQPGSKLNKDQYYLLPIKIVKYDGKSIRSTLKCSDLSKAKELQTYNEALVQSGLKPKSYTKDNNLWVPEYINLSSESSNEVVKWSNSTGKANKINQSPGNEFKRELVSDTKLLKAPEEFNETKFTELNKHLKNSEGKVKQVSNKILTVNLFGPKDSQVPVESNELSDQVFYIIPGHGGPDPGAMYKDTNSEFTFCEDEYAYDVSLRLARNLLTKGAIVYLIVQDKNDGIRDERYLDCDSDEVCIGDHDMPVNQLKRLKQGMIKTNQLYLQNKLEGIEKQWMISIHIDSQTEENRQDVFFYYQSESKGSKKKAKELKSLFSDKYKKFQGREYNGTISARPLYVMRTSEADPIYIELANIRNIHDRERIASPRNRQLIADWILEGFLL